MKKIHAVALFLLVFTTAVAQNVMTPELLWQLGRVSIIGTNAQGDKLYYRVSTPIIAENKNDVKYFYLPLPSGAPVATDQATAESIENAALKSPDGQYAIRAKEVKIKQVAAIDFYPELPKSTARIYESLNYRHWDEWEDGSYSHVFLSHTGATDETDIMANEANDCPQKTFGGNEDHIWSPDSKSILYVAKKKFGTGYAVSTNTDLYQYDIATHVTTNLTPARMGYDNNPAFSPSGTLAWLSMKRDGYESDKNDIIIKTGDKQENLTEKWDGTVGGFRWSKDSKKIFFLAAIKGTEHLFEINVASHAVKQITSGDFDVTSMGSETNGSMIVTRTDMNHAAELYNVNLTTGQIVKITHVNDAVYSKLSMSKTEKRMVTTTDGKQMVTWVIYPPNFDPAKKYPTLLYCQGGPQSALTQFYSFRWNFQLMAANGYIVVAPNRRGMPGYGVAWNEEISKDHGGQAIKDYLSAIDDVAKEPYVDKSRLGCVGASYGGYSVFYLAGVHEKRFKTFIAHDGIFNLKSMYGTTEELFFVDWDLGGAYWDKGNAAAQKSYSQFDPSNFVDRWDTPILIFQGEKDYRVPLGQGMEAFQAAQLKGIKSKLVLFPDENHWVLHAQNAQVWQREFFKWLKETL